MRNENKRDTNLNELEKSKIQHDCAGAPFSGTTQALSKRGKSMEDLWFREHEAELLEVARARQGQLICTNHCEHKQNAAPKVKSRVNTSVSNACIRRTKLKGGTMKQLLVIACGMTYVIFSTMAIAVVYGYGATLLSILAGSIGIAIINDCVK